MEINLTKAHEEIHFKFMQQRLFLDSAAAESSFWR